MKLALALLGAFLAALLAAELTMQPSAGDRAFLASMFLAVTALTGLAGAAIRRLTAGSLRHAVLGIAVAGVAVAALAVLVSAFSMFLSSHDLRLVLVALGLGVALGLALAGSLAEPLIEDLRAVAGTARAAADHDRRELTGVDRRDEVGDVARALDHMVVRLGAAEEERARVEAARGEFLAAIGHDLRTPLTSLRGGLEALQDGLVDEPAALLRALQREVGLVSSLVDDLFLLARIESGGLRLTTEPLDLAEVADEAIESIAPVAGLRGVTVRLTTRGAVPVIGNGRELGRVVRNLLDNAVRHSPDRADVVVAVTATPRPTLVVRDQGPGFDAKFLQRAFETFTRADPARTRDGGGAGLGLAIARGLAEAHGGEVSARAGPGGEVTLRLPAVVDVVPRV